MNFLSIFDVIGPNRSAVLQLTHSRSNIHRINGTQDVSGKYKKSDIHTIRLFCEDLSRTWYRPGASWWYPWILYR